MKAFKKRRPSKGARSADLSHLSDPEETRSPLRANVEKNKAGILSSQNQKGALILSNENLQIPSAYQALEEIIEEKKKLKRIGFYACNVTNSRLAEILESVRGRVTQLELSDHKREVNKKAVRGIAKLFQEETTRKKSSLLI